MKALDRNLVERAALSKLLFLFLDYDGTLTPIVRRPELALLSSEARDVLRQLRLLPGVEIGIISGRTLANLKKLISVSGIFYAGNHGYEIQGPGLTYSYPGSEEIKRCLGKIAARLKRVLSGIKGLFVEDKGYTISIHYRQVRSLKKVFEAKNIVKTELAALRNNPLALSGGKKAWEIRPTAQWHKGKAVSLILRHVEKMEKKKFSAVYIGDDRTDEDAFRCLNGASIAVVSGTQKRSHAKYYVRSSGEVLKFLGQLIKLRRNIKAK